MVKTYGKIEKALDESISKRYRSYRAFAQEIGIPHNTVLNILSRGIDNSSYGTVRKIVEHSGLTFAAIHKIERTL